MLLEQTHTVLADSRVATASNADIGTFVGIAGGSDFSSLCADFGLQATAYTVTGLLPSLASGRIAYTFQLNGAAVSVDTSCSSSLVAATQAAAPISSGKITGAVVAGVMLALVPNSMHLLHVGGILASDGRCKLLDDSSDGYGRGEDCTALIFWSSSAPSQPQAP
eukprot:scaffold46302_cov43-Prasinocladus_malaysianus.AAC.1